MTIFFFSFSDQLVAKIKAMMAWVIPSGILCIHTDRIMVRFVFFQNKNRIKFIPSLTLNPYNLHPCKDLSLAKMKGPYFFSVNTDKGDGSDSEEPDTDLHFC